MGDKHTSACSVDFSPVLQHKSLTSKVKALIYLEIDSSELCNFQVFLLEFC